MLLLGAGLALFSARLPADFAVRDVQARIIDLSVVFNARLELNLSARTEEALSKGIPLDIVAEFGLILHRWLLWDKEIADWRLRRRLQYHALSGQYLVSGLEPDIYEVESFASLQDALGYIGNFNNAALPLTKKKKISPDNEYSLVARVYLDIESLPSPLRPVAYTTPPWHHNSGWTQWNVTQ
ncbi:MAG TPA: DUF4390 domain-containing protein [Acidiferrobacterales bacterium]